MLSIQSGDTSYASSYASSVASTPQQQIMHAPRGFQDTSISSTPAGPPPPPPQGGSPASAVELEAQRAQLKEQMDAALAEDKDEQLLALVQQWNQITAKRDSILHRKVEQQALLTKYRSMLALLATLKNTTMSAKASSPSEFQIRCNVKDLFKQVETFCRLNNVTEAVCEKLEFNIAKYTMPKAVAVAAVAAAVSNIPPPPPLPPSLTSAAAGFIPPPPPPPMPTLNFALSTSAKPFALPKRPKVQVADRLKAGSKSVQFRSPLRSINTDVLSQIAMGGKAMLKQTPFKCSPGGTPFKPKFKSAHGDLEAALKKKFQSVMINSPLASPMPGHGASPCPFGTPTAENMMSPVVTELDNSACGTPYTEPVFMAPVIDARPYEGTPEPVA